MGRALRDGITVAEAHGAQDQRAPSATLPCHLEHQPAIER